MDLTKKKVWDLTPREIEYLYNNVHLNNYVYAGLNCFHKSRMPLNKIITLKHEKIPKAIQKDVLKLVQLSPYLGNDDSRIIRINYTYYAFLLFKALSRIKVKDTPGIIELLATLAYIPIVAEKNDNFALWLHPVLRKPDERIHKIFNAIKKDINIPPFLNLCLYNNEQMDNYTSPLKSTFLFMRAVQSIIIMTENNEDKKKLAEVWKNLEFNMTRYERENGLSGSEYKGNMQRAGQIRYRNTIYLYGGDFFRRMKDYETAFEWYTKDIYFEQLPDLFGFYLTDMKTTERLICAYGISKKKGGDDFLKKLIIKCFYRICQNASNYAESILEFISTHPGLDISLSRLPDNGRYKLYAGEASREIFLISLLYHNIINGVNYEDIDYRKFLKYN